MIKAKARIIAVAVARIGDTLLVTPALRALRAACPDGTLAVAAHPKRMAVLAHLPFIDSLQPASPARLVLGRLRRAGRFDWAFVWGNDTALVRHALRMAERVVAFRSGEPTLDASLHCAVNRPSRPEHAVIERLRLPRAVGVDTTELRLAYTVTPAEAANAHARLNEAFASRPRPLVALQLRSFPTKAYRDWPHAYFEALAARILAAHSGSAILILGDEASAPLGKAFAARFPSRAISLAGKLALRETAAVLALADLYVGVDTGPTHLAGALGIPMVALYHCRHRGCLLAPLQHPALEVIEHPATDAQCSEATRMDEIALDTVWEAVRRRLAAPIGIVA